jgi:hypothetical protein
MVSRQVHCVAVSNQNGPVATGDDAVAPGSLRLKERRSWPTWVVLAAALVAAGIGALTGYLPNRGSTSAGPSGPSFPSAPLPTARPTVPGGTILGTTTSTVPKAGTTGGAGG